MPRQRDAVTILADHETAIRQMRATLARIGSGGSLTLEGLSDTDVTTPSAGDILVWDGADSWDNSTLAAQDIATVTYVDAEIAGIDLSDYLALAGGTMTGAIDFAGDSVNVGQINPRQDVGREILELWGGQAGADDPVLKLIGGGDSSNAGDIYLQDGGGGVLLQWDESDDRWNFGKAVAFGSPTSGAALMIGASGSPSTSGLLVEGHGDHAGHTWLGYADGNTYLTQDDDGFLQVRGYNGSTYSTWLEVYGDTHGPNGGAALVLKNAAADSGLWIETSNGPTGIFVTGDGSLSAPEATIVFRSSPNTWGFETNGTAKWEVDLDNGEVTTYGDTVMSTNGYIYGSGGGSQGHIRFSTDWIAFHHDNYAVLAYGNRVEGRAHEYQPANGHTFYGDTDTGIDRQGTNHIGFRAGGNDRSIHTDDALHVNVNNNLTASSTGLRIGDNASNIGNVETARANYFSNGTWDTTDVGYYSSMAVDPKTGRQLKKSITRGFEATAMPAEVSGPASFSPEWVDWISPSFYRRTDIPDALASPDMQGGWELGFVLEDLARVSPYLTTKSGERVGASPDEFALIATLWEALRDARARIKKLEEAAT